MMSRALIDGDIVTYSVGHACDTVKYICRNTNVEFATKSAADAGSTDWYIEVEAEPIENCLHSVKLMLQDIVDKSGCTTKTIYLTGKDNFRGEIYDEYKANRKGQRKPTHYEAIREYLIKYHTAIVINNMEADDALGIEQCRAIAEGETTVICTIDKDLDMIPGWHYNWRKESLYSMEDPECLRIFFKQCLTGDAGDNIPGLFKIMKKKATKARKEAIDGMDTFDEMWDYVSEQYEGHEMFPVIASLLWIKRKPDGGRVQEILESRDGKENPAV
jgi:hypothetical protein